MVTDLGAAAECKIHEVNPSGVNDSEGLRARLGTCTWIRGMVSKLKDVTSLSERRFLEIGSVPFLRLVSAAQNHSDYMNELTSIKW